MHITYQ